MALKRATLKDRDKDTDRKKRDKAARKASKIARKAEATPADRSPTDRRVR